MSFVKALQGVIDFKGQDNAKAIFQTAAIISAIISFCVGFYRQSLQELWIIYAAGVLIGTLLSVPPWPYLNQAQVKWLNPYTKAKEASSSTAKETKTSTAEEAGSDSD